MSLLPFVPLIAIFGLATLLRAVFGSAFPLRWWLLRLGALPLLFFVFAIYILSFPTPIPADYDPHVHGNPGRMDYVAVLFWRIVAPVAYLVFAFPISLGYAIWRNCKRQQSTD